MVVVDLTKILPNLNVSIKSESFLKSAIALAIKMAAAIKIFDKFLTAPMTVVVVLGSLVELVMVFPHTLPLK